MASEKFTLTKERLVEWLSDAPYMEKYRSQVYKSILRFYFDSFFTEIYPAERAILEIEKDLGRELDREALLKLFYFDYWSRKKKKERARQQVAPSTEPVEPERPDTEPINTSETTLPPPDKPVLIHNKETNTAQVPESPRFDFRDAKEIAPNKKPLYVGKKQRQQQSDKGPDGAPATP